MADKIVAMFAYPPTLLIFPGVSKYFIKSPSLPVRAPNLPANTYRGLFQKFFINFSISEISKRRIKKELDLVLLFELFSIGKKKTEQSNCIWLEINQSNCTIHGKNWHDFHLLLSMSGTFGRPWGDFQRVFRHCQKWYSYIMQRFQDISRFLHSWRWQVRVWWCHRLPAVPPPIIKIYLMLLRR